MSGYLRLLNDVSEGYFKNNKIEIGEGIPTKGSYKKGDLVINVGRVPSKCPIWLCVYDGTPGRWIEVGSVHENVLQGNLKDLITNNKSDVISAINEVVESVKVNSDNIDLILEKVNAIEGSITNTNIKLNNVLNKL